MKKTILRVLLCLTAAVLLASSALAQPVQAERVRVLVVQNADTNGVPSELLAVLASIPALDFDYAIAYDDGHVAVCTLPKDASISARGEAIAAWAESAPKSRVRNTTHATALNAAAELTADVSLLDVVWVPAWDASSQTAENTLRAVESLEAAGANIRLYAGLQMTALQSAVSAAEGAELLVVGDPWVEVTDSLLGEAGYYHQTTEAIAEVLRTTEVHPANVLPGDTVLIDRCANYEIVGSSFTYGSASAAAAPSTAGLAVVYTAAAADAEEEPLPEASLPEQDRQVTLSSFSVGPDTVFSAIAQQHQLCWYFRPAAECGVQASLDPASAPYDISPRVTFSLNLTPTADSPAAREICESDLLSGTGRFTVSAVLRTAAGEEQPLQLQPSGHPGVYRFILDRSPGTYTVLTTISLADMPYSYPAMRSTLVMEQPLPVEAKQDVEAISLNAAPMLWHKGDTTAEIRMNELFTGSYLPVAVKNADTDMVEVAGSGDVFTITALSEGTTQLFFLSRDGATGVLVPVKIENGQKQVLMEGGAALIALLLIVFCVLYPRMHQPRFRKGEKLLLTIDGGYTYPVSLKSYGKAGVTLWRMLTVNGVAADYKADSAALRHIAVVPRRDAIIVNNDKNVSTLVTGQPMRISCGAHTFEITLEAGQPEA